MAVKKQWSERHGREVWGYKAKVGGKRRQRFGFSTEAAARTALSKARVAAYERKQGVAPPAEKPLPAVTVKQLVAARVAQLQTTPRRRVSAGLIERWLQTLPVGLLVTELKTAHLQAYQDKRLGEVKPQTVFRELTDVCVMLNRARDTFAELEDWTPPRRPRLKAPNGTRDRILTPAEVLAILAALRRPRGQKEAARWHRVRLDVADLFEIALLSAARKGEILSLRWTDVNFELQTLRVTGTKTDRVRVIPMPPSLVELLRRRRAAAGRSPLVFPLMAGPTMLRYNSDLFFRDAARVAGIPYGRDVAGGWVLHDARHTAITAMLDAGSSLQSVMAISGHNARVMTMRYAHATDRTRRAAVDALEQFAPGNMPPFSAPAATDVTHMTRVTHKAARRKSAKKGEKKKSPVKTRVPRA